MWCMRKKESQERKRERKRKEGREGKGKERKRKDKIRRKEKPKVTADTLGQSAMRTESPLTQMREVHRVSGE